MDVHQAQPLKDFAGITLNLVTVLGSASHPVQSRWKTLRSAASGDRRHWPHPSHLFYIMDKSSGYRFLIDTGAEISAIPPSHSDSKYRQEGCNLLAVNGSTIATYGKKSLTLDLELQHIFRWIFIIANVQSPILGADFLRQYSLLVDMKHCRLVDALT